MTIKYTKAFRDPLIARGLLKQIESTTTPVRLMEVCGTHTVAIFRSGIRSVLPPTLSLLSGPGCPVCVTAQGEIDAFIDLARVEEMIVTTYGDLMRVPGSASSLQKERADGRDVRIVYSTFDALKIAQENPDRKVVFLGVGFETTAPTIAASVVSARQMGLKNYTVYCAHKTVPVALAALLENPAVKVNGFILPGHVSVIIGLNAYRPLFEQYRIPCAVAGFEPTDILQAVAHLVKQIETGTPQLFNAYTRAVSDQGNRKAQTLLEEVFEPVDAVWRGLGTISGSGLGLRDQWDDYNAQLMFNINPSNVEEPKGCMCGEVLTGIKIPPECALYKKVCTPADPVGPCMVSSEGTCAAYYRFHNP